MADWSFRNKASLEKNFGQRRKVEVNYIVWRKVIKATSDRRPSNFLVMYKYIEVRLELFGVTAASFSCKCVFQLCCH